MADQEYRICSKCGTRRAVDEAVCPSCGKRRSRRIHPPCESFWSLPLDVRREIAKMMYAAVAQDWPEEQAAAMLFARLGRPRFKEFRRYYRLMTWSFRTTGGREIDFTWYRDKPAKHLNPVTGLRWPPRE